MIGNKILLAIVVLPLVYGLSRKELVDFAAKQYHKAIQHIQTGSQYPALGHTWSDHWDQVTPPVQNQWTAGFYPGVLWHLYNYTKSDEWKQLAIRATDAMYDDQYNTWQHDVGFMIMCSYGDGYAFTKNANYPKIIINAANHLAKRFNAKVGCTKSWDTSNPNDFLVIVDNMMNLELLFEGWRLSGDKKLYDMALSHTEVTIREHLRKDYGSFHVVNFNPHTGQVTRKYTATGYADWSTWSQGQAWLVAGLTMAYRYTKADHVLKAAEGVSNYFIDNSPADGVPLWDFNVPHDPQHPYIHRDSSAASIAATGLIELYGFTKNVKYLNAFNKIMDSLSSGAYRANGKPQYKVPALIVNGSTDRNNYDTALIFGDYYYIKAFNHLV